jgi:single-strand DNA-binding protein
MSTNSLHFNGHLASDPVLNGKGDHARCKVLLIANEYAGKDKEARKVAILFTAFRGKAEAIGAHMKKGDQLIVRARIENNNYTHDGVDRYDYNFIIEDFDFGAPGAETRKALAERA